MTIKESLQKGAETLFEKNIKSAFLDAEILLLHALNQFKNKNKPKSFTSDRSWLYAHDNYNLDKNQKDKFFKLIVRRKRFEPIAYITGRKEFFGLNFHVNKNVLIPRPETEILVENALKDITWKLSFQVEAQLPSNNKKITIADIGTGSGAIAVSIAKTLKDRRQISRAKIYATDISANALKIAKINAKMVGAEKYISFKKGDLLKALPLNLKVDFLLANLPYVGDDYYYYCKWLKNGSRPAEFFEIKHEPKKSLLAENNGLEYFEKFFKQAPEHLAKNAKIFLESDPHQIPMIKKLAKKYLPKHKFSVIKDLRGLNRITRIEISV